MSIFVTVLLYVFLCMITGAIASSKGRSGFGWFLFGTLLSPVLGLIIIACLSPVTKPAKVY